jgi:hypothetical protein
MASQAAADKRDESQEVVDKQGWSREPPLARQSGQARNLRTPLRRGVQGTDSAGSAGQMEMPTCSLL